MKQEDKDLLLRDLCARLPYGVKVITSVGGEIRNDKAELNFAQLSLFKSGYEDVKPYLFPLSSMTEEQKQEYHALCIEEEREQREFGEWVTRIYYHNTIESIDWLNENNFDYRDLIPMGLAIDATGLNIY